MFLEFSDRYPLGHSDDGDGIFLVGGVSPSLGLW